MSEKQLRDTHARHVGKRILIVLISIVALVAFIDVVGGHLQSTFQNSYGGCPIGGPCGPPYHW
jgi:hypothetical protein